ncbi:MAG: lipoprotein insertase outer membrane protein LolB [Gammaproteobacteria bacterium]
MRIVAVLLLAALSACSVAPTGPPVDRAKVWAEHERSISRLDRWTIRGRVALSTEDEGWSAALQWQQRGTDYDIRVIAPFGQGSMRLQGGAAGVVLRTSDHPQPVYAANAEALLRSRTGWRMPVTALRYWIRGLPQPAGARTIQLDDRGRLAHLIQGGWSVDFLGYQRVDDYQLPEKIFMKNRDLRIRVVIHDWQLGG